MGLPAPHGGLAGAGAVHDLGGAAAISGQQQDSHAARRQGILVHWPSNSYCDIGGVKYQLEELV
jgi:hypothetical protein